MHKEHIYAVTRIHIEERRLLGAQDMERLLAQRDIAACYELLAEKGWGAPDVPQNDAEALLACEDEKTWALVCELAGGLAPFDVFCREHDFHNLKAAIKLAYAGKDREDTRAYFQCPGSVDAADVLRAAQRNDFDGLPRDMAEAGRAAVDVLLHTQNGRSCEIILDRAALLAIDAAGKAAESDLLRLYARLRVDGANIKAAVRACRMGKDRAFLERVVAPAGSLDRGALIDAAARSLEEIYAYLARTEYAEGARALADSLAAFECWCDRRLIEYTRPQRYEYFSIEPLAAYILARRIEIAMVRLILTAKQNRLDDAVVWKRWRLLYV